MPQQTDTTTPTFEEQLIELRPALVRHAYRLCGNPDLADDLVQDTIVRAIDRKQHFRPGSNLRAWTFTILRNMFYAQWHKTKRMTPWELWLDDSLVVSGGQEEAAELNCIVDRFHEMPASQRDALALVGVGGCSYDEAAAIGQCAVGTMKSRVSRARATLLDGALQPKRRSARSGFDVLIDFCSSLMPQEPWQSSQQKAEPPLGA